MRDPVESIVSALRRDEGGFAIIYFPDYSIRDWLVREVESIAGSSARPVRVGTVHEALSRPESLALLVPEDETTTVRELEARRDMFLESGRREPVVLFLLRDGPGQRALAGAPGFASLVRGSDPDPELFAEMDVVAERRAFETRTGARPEAWLARWRSGGLQRNAENLALAYHALLLEE